MSDETNGAAYRVKTFHPRRPDQPLRVTDKDGHLIAEAGQTCENVSPSDLASMISNGYVELITPEEGGA